MSAECNQARANVDYWIQWAQNPNNLALQRCSQCGRAHLRDTPFCLDCHSRLVQLAPFFYRCQCCAVAHGFSGGTSSPYGRFHRSGLLVIKRGDQSFDFTHQARISSDETFQKWLRRTRRRS